MADLALAGGAEDQLLESLSFKLPGTASYVTGRRLVKFYPSGASDFSPNGGVRVARINLAAQGGWLDPSSLKVAFRLVNNSDLEQLVLAAGPWCIFDRIRLFLGGTLIEDLGPAYGRTHQLFKHLLMPNNHVANVAIESGTQYYDVEDSRYSWGINSTHIAPGYYATCMFTPFCGLLSAGKMIPVAYAPLTIELTLADPQDAILVDDNMHIEPTNSSLDYTVSQLCIHATQLRLDSALDNSFAQLLMNGRNLTFSLRTVHCQTQLLPDNSVEFQISLTRALSRLNAVFVSFNDNRPRMNRTAVSFANPSARVPGHGNTAYSHEELNLCMQLQVGSLLFPETRIESMPEFFSRLAEALDVYDQSIRTINIYPQKYQDVNFCAGFNLQKVPQVLGSGLNTRSGDLLTVKCTNIQAGLTGLRCWLHLVSECMVEIRESGVSLLD